MKNRLLPIAFCLVAILHSPFTIQAQDSSHLRISLLTCGQGDEVYSTFGHTAISVIDSAAHTDIVYNYGTFDFDAPGFIYNFVKGKLNYFVSVSTFDDFMYEYQYEKREVWEQELILTEQQKKEMNAFLQWNALPENKNYSYDFIKDNCTTRVRDIIAKNIGDSLIFDKIETPKDTSYRDGINHYSGKLSWLNFGMNVLLGARTDEEASDHRFYFLPDYLKDGVARIKINDQPIAKAAKLIYDPKTKATTAADIFSPILVFGLLAVIITGLSFSKNQTAKKILSVFDLFFFTTLGLLGCFILFMWFGTDHYWCKDNMNLLWAWPTHLVFIFLQKKETGIRYFKIVSVASLLFAILHPLFHQHIPLAALILVIIVLVRSWQISR